MIIDTSGIIAIASMLVNGVLVVMYRKATKLLEKHKVSISKLIVASIDGDVTEAEFQDIVASVRKELYG
ncbi:MAG: hypothetical protein ACTSPB_02065 [Candidatus Thorarchaeota archaeon]